MTKIEAIIQPGRFEAVKEALTEGGITGMTISEVRGHGRQKGHTETYRGREYSVDLLPKVKVELVIDDAQVSAAVDAINRQPLPHRTRKVADKIDQQPFFWTLAFRQYPDAVAVERLQYDGAE